MTTRMHYEPQENNVMMALLRIGDHTLAQDNFDVLIFVLAVDQERWEPGLLMQMIDDRVLIGVGLDLQRRSKLWRQ